MNTITVPIEPSKLLGVWTKQDKWRAEEEAIRLAENTGYRWQGPHVVPHGSGEAIEITITGKD